VVHARRGTPDISMSAAVDGGVLVNIGFTGGDGITPGYGQTFTVPGFQAVPSYDLASGLGTLDAAKLVRELGRR
jgi:hypothetical protein